MSEIGQVIALPQSPEVAIRRDMIPTWWMTGTIGVLLAVIYFSILTRLVTQWWNDPNWSHGFVVPLFAAFLVWRRRDDIARTTVRPSWVGLAVVCAGLITLVVGVLGAELFLSRSSLIIILGGLVIHFLGWGYFRAVLFPWLFLFLMVPIPAIIFNKITFPLQLLVSQLSSLILSGIGVPVLREGNIIRLAAMPLEVAEACSGIRSLLSLFTLALIFGYFAETKIWKRTLLCFISLPIAVAANAARIVGTGLMVQYWDPAKALGFFHEFSGWVIFLVSLALLLGAQHTINAGLKLSSRGRR